MKAFIKSNAIIFGYVALLAIARFFLPFSFLVDVIIFCIYALGFDFTCGYMGWLSLGQVLYLGVGSYTTALFIKYLNPNPFLALLSSLAVAAFIGFILSFVVLRKGGPYFALLNLAFASVGHFLILIPLKDITGGNDGLWFKMGAIPFLDLRDRNVYFTFLLIVFLVILLVYKRLVSSGFSYLLRAIKENETRVAFLGYNTFRIKTMAFVLSVMLSTLAGSLYSMAYSYASPSFMEPRRCGEVVVATLIGGSGTFYGVLMGTFLIIGLKDLISSYITTWEFVLGVIFVLIMFISRRGLFDLIIKLRGGQR